jgi:ABC-type multidrug transport system fused ATPase/permease subunit
VRTELRLLRLVRPYRGLLGLGVATTFLASLLDGFTLVILIPLLKHLFGTTGELRAGSTQLEAFVTRLVQPLVEGLTPGQAAARLVVVLVVGLLLKNALAYASSQISVGVQEGLVRDLRTRIFDHLLTLDLGYFQRTRAGQLISGIITEVDQTKAVITASLISLFQNIVVVATTLAVLSQISVRLTLLTLACVPVMVLLLQSLLRRLRRHSRARARERGEVTSTITERIGAVRLIRAYGEEARESARFHSQATRYRK